MHEIFRGKMRLQSFMAKSGVASRRQSEEMIRSGRVRLNGELVTQMGVRISSQKDVVEVDGVRIGMEDALKYYWLNKPVGVVSTAKKQNVELIVTELIPEGERAYPVGRLDKESHGLMLLTNDGELTHRLTHPKYHIPKTYEVVVGGTVTEKKLNTLRTGIILGDEKTLPLEVEVIKHSEETTTLRMVLHEGRNRQIRRMMPVVDLHVHDLKRVAFGPVELDNLESGKFREASKEEVGMLKKLTRLEP